MHINSFPPPPQQERQKEVITELNGGEKEFTLAPASPKLCIETASLLNFRKRAKMDAARAGWVFGGG